MTANLPSHAVIGAGIAGLACARVLAAAGHGVTVFDKGRGPGGRMSSRRLEDAIVELGAQSLRAGDSRFRAEVAAWERAGVVAPWPRELWRLEAGRLRRLADGRPRHTGVPRMSAVTRHLARGLALRVSTRIDGLARDAAGWWLRDQAGARHGPFASAILAVPTPQAEALAAPHAPDLAAECRGIAQRACWAAWASFDVPLAIPGLPDDWPVLDIAEGPLRRVIRHRTKPGRSAQPETLTLLARLDWSERHLEAASRDTAARLLDALHAALPKGAFLPLARASDAHRWRYAEPVVAPGADTIPGQDFRLDASGLALCGDGWRGARIEDAWLSGHHLGEFLCRHHADPILETL
ncbi:NAD(P)/FAD-dependent oxidoreductase [Halomonas beimenensis]|uniref:Amine oxidase, flavin-containing n=1 Tax=Halomonas beimenensis TaxID=475662 RepID=A0A291PBW8_9GAMM|nr:FAD-dependent oxidoreductase [Halomonas beimenensis]ATJ84380.1 amine oxidase, flavin-containing [Halomonas beimenensis]